jgi:hypothetical protein
MEMWATSSATSAYLKESLNSNRIYFAELPPGEHTIFYNIRITPTGALTSPGTNPHFADITYKLQMT